MSTNSGALFTEERRRRIVDLVRDRKSVTVNELCQLFGVSQATVRTDLRELDDGGLLLRTHGGAIEKTRTGFEQISSKRLAQNLAAKQAIAEQAKKLVEDGDTVLLDTGTTTLELASQLRDYNNLKVVTNDIEIARVLEEIPGVEVVLLGGILRKGHHCTVGPLGRRLMEDLRVDKAFMATNSLSVEAGATTPDLQQAEAKKAMIAIASKVILLCDSSKLGKESLVRFAGLTDIDLVVTDSVEQKKRQAFEKHGVELFAPSQ